MLSPEWDILILIIKIKLELNLSLYSTYITVVIKLPQVDVSSLEIRPAIQYLSLKHYH